MFIEREKYRDIIGLMPILCVDLFVIQEGKLLLWKRTNNPLKWEWCIPWWRLFIGEKLQDAARRKLKEELWIDSTEKLDTLWTYETIFDINSFNEAKPYHTVNHVFIVRMDKGSPLVADNQNEELWFFEIEPQSFFPNYINLLMRDYLKTYG